LTHARLLLLLLLLSLLLLLFIYLFFSGNDQEEEIKHDIDNALPKVDGWKAHILRAAHQDAAKSDIIDNLSPSQVLLIMD